MMNVNWRIFEEYHKGIRAETCQMLANAISASQKQRVAEFVVVPKKARVIGHVARNVVAEAEEAVPQARQALGRALRRWIR
jgi:hypothetical protein